MTVYVVPKEDFVNCKAKMVAALSCILIPFCSQDKYIIISSRPKINNIGQIPSPYLTHFHTGIFH